MHQECSKHLVGLREKERDIDRERERERTRDWVSTTTLLVCFSSISNLPRPVPHFVQHPVSFCSQFSSEFSFLNCQPSKRVFSCIPSAFATSPSSASRWQARFLVVYNSEKSAQHKVKACHRHVTPSVFELIVLPGTWDPAVTAKPAK